MAELGIEPYVVTVVLFNKELKNFPTTSKVDCKL